MADENSVYAPLRACGVWAQMCVYIHGPVLCLQVKKKGPFGTGPSI